MNPVELLHIIDQIHREKNIERGILVEAIEAALGESSMRILEVEDNLQAHLDPESGEIEVFCIKRVVEELAEETEEPGEEITLEEARKIDPEAEIGGEVRIDYEPPEFDRIAAQTAKHVLLQRVRESEQEMVYEYYKDRVNETVVGTSLRYERGNLIIDLGRTEGEIPRRELIPNEGFRRGDRVMAYLIRVKTGSRGPQVILSRTHPGLLVKLFEMEVPEVYEGVVEIRGAVREPGQRAKICVVSKDRNVDPVGACVGVKGSRVQNIVQELNGENIDIIQWTDSTESLVRNALNPARISEVHMDVKNNSIEIVVPEDQLSLAIGRKGQNVRLAARLIGWKIDITGEKEYLEKQVLRKQKEEDNKQIIARIQGVGPKLADMLWNREYRSIEDVAKAQVDDLMTMPGVGRKKAETMVKWAREKCEESLEDESERYEDAGEAIPPDNENEEI